MPQQIAVAETTMPVLGKGRMVGNRLGQIEAAEPAIRKVQMNLFAKPPLRADARPACLAAVPSSPCPSANPDESESAISRPIKQSFSTE
jgi:hypothetical protein